MPATAGIGFGYAREDAVQFQCYVTPVTVKGDVSVKYPEYLKAALMQPSNGFRNGIISRSIKLQF